MRILYVFIIFLSLILNGCSKVRESAGVNRKQIDEFQVLENPPLVIPPDFNLISPDQLEEKNIDDIEKELAKEILFGLDENEILLKQQLSTLDKILSEADATNMSNDIIGEIDKEFSQELNVDSIFQTEWETEIEVLDAIKESERIRNKKFNEDLISEGEIPIKKQKIKKKKKKRFFFF